MEFTKFSDKQDLLKLHINLQSEKLIIQSTISEHGIKCQSVLDSCKEKFSQSGCELTESFIQKELEDSIKATKKSMEENQEINSEIKKLIDSTNKDCTEISTFYHDSKLKLEKDGKTIMEIKHRMNIKLEEIKKEEELRKAEEERKRIEAARIEAARIESLAISANNTNSIKDQIAFGNFQNKNFVLKNSTISNNSQSKNESIPSAVAPKTEITIPNVLKNDTVISSNITVNTKLKAENKTNEGVNNTSIYYFNLALNVTKSAGGASFAEIQKETLDINQGFFTSLFEKITGAFSLIQLKQNSINNIEGLSFSQIEGHLRANLTPAQQINFLLTTLHEFKIIQNSLKESVEYIFKLGAKFKRVL